VPETPRQVTPAALEATRVTVNIALGLRGEPLYHGLTWRQDLNMHRALMMGSPPIPSPHYSSHG
jgi:hypothetical protein